MKRCGIICAVLLCSTAFSYAATPDALWQDYQKNPGYVSTTPTKPAPTPTPHVTVETQDGSVSEPTTPEQAKDKAEIQPADTEKTAEENNVETAKENTTQSSDEPTTQSNTQEEANVVSTEQATSETVGEQGDSSVFNQTPTVEAGKAPIISNKPVASADKPKPKPKLNLVGKPPLPKQFMRTPQAGDFTNISSISGGYSVAVPAAFGSDPLATLPQAEGAMLVRTASDDLMCAVTVLDAADTTSYNATQQLPQYENKHVYWTWQHDATLIWNCTLSSHNDYHGDKMLLEAQAEQNGKTYQMLFVMPMARFTDLLPQAVYSLNSFQLN